GAPAASDDQGTSGAAHEQADRPLRDMEMTTDPVCGMEVDPAKAAARREHDGATYYFCCDGCRDLFRADPGKYAARPAPTIHPSRSPGAAPSRFTTGSPARYTCPMHPQIESDAPGACPICGMAPEPLIPALGCDNAY